MSEKGVPLYSANFVEGVPLPGLEPGVIPGVETTICVATRMDRNDYDLSFAKLDGMPAIAVINRKSGLVTHVPMTNVRSFVVLSEAHERVLTDPKRKASAVGLVRSLV